MANQITDNRTPINAADSATGYVDISGSAAGSLDTEIFFEGTGSIGQYMASTLDGLLYDYGSAQNLSSNVFYFLINCGVVGLLDTKALGGFRIRFTGATVTDWFEVYVAGSDEWPTSFAGGWTLFVVDIEDARSTAVTNGWVSGTTPATSAIQRVGWAGITAGTMPRMVDNTWMDAMYRLADGNPSIIIEGRNAGVTDWTWDNVVSEMTLINNPVARNADGGAITLSGPVQFGINDTSTHAFNDTNKIILWDNQEYAPSDLYKLSALGNAGGTTNVTMGVKTGTGPDATGAQGVVVAAAATGARWDVDFNDPNIDGANFYGCSFIHAGALLLDDPAVSVISSLYIDCTSALISNSEQLRISVVNANTLDDVAFMTTDDIGDIKNSTFEFSDGHAIELTTPRIAAQTSTGNIFTGYTETNGSTDAALYNNTAGLVDISVVDGALFYYKNGTSASTTVTVSVGISITGLSEGTRGVMIGDGGIEDGNELLGGYANSGGTITGAFGGSTPQSVIVRARNGGIVNAAILEDNGTGNTDYTDDAREAVGADDVLLLPATPALNDAFYFGGIAEFEKILIDVSTAGDTYVATWEYWNGAWVALTATDDTNSFQTVGWNSIEFTKPSDWATTSFNTQGPFYYVRLRVTTGGGTQPKAEGITLNKTTKYLPFSSTGTIQSGTGLVSTAVWIRDIINL